MPSLPAVDDAVIAATTNAKNNYNDADEEGGEGEEVRVITTWTTVDYTFIVNIESGKQRGRVATLRSPPCA